MKAAVYRHVYTLVLPDILSVIYYDILSDIISGTMASFLAYMLTSYLPGILTFFLAADAELHLHIGSGSAGTCCEIKVRCCPQ